MLVLNLMTAEFSDLGLQVSTTGLLEQKFVIPRMGYKH